jgi:hypothetical protein
MRNPDFSHSGFYDHMTLHPFTDDAGLAYAEDAAVLREAAADASDVGEWLWWNLRALQAQRELADDRALEDSIFGPLVRHRVAKQTSILAQRIATAMEARRTVLGQDSVSW